MGEYILIYKVKTHKTFHFKYFCVYFTFLVDLNYYNNQSIAHAQFIEAVELLNTSPNYVYMLSTNKKLLKSIITFKSYKE